MTAWLECKQVCITTRLPLTGICFQSITPPRHPTGFAHRLAVASDCSVKSPGCCGNKGSNKRKKAQAEQETKPVLSRLGKTLL